MADALNWAGISEDDFNEKLAQCSSETERANLITETLNETYKESADNYRENNAEIIKAREATSNYEDAQKSLGDAIRPLTTQLTNLKTKGLQWFVDTGLPFLKDNLPAIATLLGGVTGAIVAQTAATKIKIAMDAAQAAGTSLVTLAQQGLNAAMKANPIGLVITGITLLVSAFMLLWNNCEGFRNFFIGLWNTLTTVVSGAVQGITGFFSGIPAFFSGIFSTAYDAITGFFKSLPAFFGGIWNSIKTTFSKLGTAIGDAIGGAVKSAINTVIGFIEDRINGAIDIINGAIDLINLLPIANVGYVQKVSLPRLAKGAVVSKATAAVVGEDGKEAIVPLERNTEWIDKVADAVVSKTGGGGVVVNQTNNYSQAHSRFEIYKSKQQTAAAVRLALRAV